MGTRKGAEDLTVFYSLTFGVKFSVCYLFGIRKPGSSKTTSKNKQANVHANNKGVSRLYMVSSKKNHLTGTCNKS
jgi:hypothetical protein